MDHTSTGTVHGNTIVLDAPLPGLEGQVVEVTIRQAKAKPTWGEGVRDSAGAWSADEAMEEVMKRIYEERKLERRDAFADDANDLSSQRPMSDEERAELERVYQDRGCSTECDE